MSDEIPRLEEVEKAGRQLGQLIGSVLPEGVGFALHLWTFGEGGWATFLSNVERSDHMAALREFLDKAAAETPTYHVVHQELPPERPGYIPSPSGPRRSFMTEEEIRERWPKRADAILEDARRMGYAWVMGANDDD